MSNPSRHSVWALTALVVLFVALACWYSVAIPPFEATDEISHFRFSEFLKQQHRLPLQSHDRAKLENVVAHNPPLYYLAVALVTLPVDTSNLDAVARLNPDFLWGDLNAGGPFVHIHDPAAEQFPWHGAILGLHLARLVSVLAGAVTVIFAYRVGRRLLGSAVGGLAVAAMTAFLPSFLFTSATVHNDAFVTMFSVVALDQLMALADDGGKPWRWALAGALIAAAGLSKLAGFLLAPLLLVPFLMTLRRAGWRDALIGGLTGGAVVLVLAAPWLAWNLANYGEPFGYVLFSTNPLFPIRDVPLSIPALGPEMGPGSLLFHTFVLAFGYMDRLGPPVVYTIASAAVAAGLIGLLAGAVIRPAAFHRQITRPAVLIAIGFTLLLGVSLARYVQTFLSGGHGRYLFPLLPLLFAGLIAGWAVVLPRRWLAVPGVAGALALALLAAITPAMIIAPGYALAGALPPQQAAALSRKAPMASFDNAIDVVDAEVTPATAAPGGTVTVRLVWRAERAIEQNYQAFVQLAGKNAGAGGVDRAPGGGLASTGRWTVGTVVEDTFILTVANDAPPGIYEVRTGFYSRDSQQRLPVTAGPDRGGATAVGRVKVPQPPGAPPQQPLDVLFGGQLRLTGLDLPLRAEPGSPAVVSVHWQAVKQPDADYTISLQLLSAENRVAAQVDGQPLAGALPTSAWESGETVIDHTAIPLPGGLAAGTYRLAVIVYRLDNGVRLDAGGTDAPTVATLNVGR